jgi:tetratricopeptide (TPR) repeat protein
MSRVATEPHRIRILAATILAALTLVAFWPVLGNGFINLDDRTYVENNDHIQDGFTLASLQWACTTDRASNWHPVTWLSHMLDWQLHGSDAGGHHLTSLIIHLANVLLLFLVMDRLTGSIMRSSFVAALFAVHPLHVESVAWIAERKDVLSTLFWMLAVLAYIRYVKRKGFTSYLVVALMLALGLAAKPMLVTLPIVLLLLDYWPLQRWQPGNDPWPVLREKIPLLVLATASGVMTLIAQRSGEAVRTFEQFPLALRISNAILSYASYLWKMIWPFDLALYYPHPGRIPIAMAAGALIALALLSALAIGMRKSRTFIIVGWLWYLVTLLPVIGLVQVGSQAMADRYTYVPLIGIFIVLAWGVPELLGRVLRKEWQVVAVGAALVLILTALTHRQAGYWRDSETLFRHTLEVTENNAVAHNSLGLALAEQKRLPEALEQYNAALSIRPHYFQARVNMAVALADQGRHAEAESHYAAALRIRSDDAQVHINMGNTLKHLGRFQEAHAHFSEALRIEPESADAYYNWGLALAKEGRLEEAAERYVMGLRLDPEDAQLHNNFGNVLARLGRIDEAVMHLKEAIRLKPDYAKAHANLASAYFFKGRYNEAWAEVREARRHGFEPPPQLVQELSEKMRDPRNH